MQALKNAVRKTVAAALLVALASTAHADVIANYTTDLGGNNTDPLNGLSARATFSSSGTQLSILLENTSTGEPASFLVGDSLLVSLGMNLPGIDIASGDLSVIGPGSVGLGAWASSAAGDSVADQWIWTNGYGGDLMLAYRNVISTSNGQGGGLLVHFGGGSGNVDGPFGGMAASPPLLTVPGSQPAVSNGISFSLTLTGTLTPAQLQDVANNSIVEFGSDQRYLGVPEPTAGFLLAAAALLRRRR